MSHQDDPSRPPPPVVLIGPTAVGKTAVAGALAGRIAPAELVNADSRQLIRGLAVGTCAPTAAELRGAPCHLVNVCEPGSPWALGEWLANAEACLTDLEERGVRPIVIGGSGLYIRALLEGYRPAPPPEPRRRAERVHRARTAAGRAVLAAELARREPGAGRAIDTRNPHRVIRALELLDVGVSPMPGPGRRGARRDAVVIGLDAPRGIHTAMVESRARTMIDSGALAAEVEDALDRGVSAAVLAAAAIGYREALSLRAGELDGEAAVAAIVRRTLRYAKAQRTWFRRETGVRWVWRDADSTSGGLAAEVATAISSGAGTDVCM